MSEKKRVAVIGGGYAGLAAAYRLLRRGHEVAVYERSHQLGGLAMTYEVCGTRLEKYYHHLFTSDRDILDLADELGVETVWPSPNSGMFHHGKVYPFTSPGDLLRFPGLPLPDRIRLGAVLFFLQRFPDGRRFEDVTAASWFRRAVGAKAYQAVIGPMLGAKFARNAERIAMVWMWGKMRTRGTSRGKGGAKESLGYIKGSFANFVDRLAEEVRRQGGTIHAGLPVQRLDGVVPNERLEQARRPGFVSLLRPARADEMPSPDWSAHRGGRMTVVTRAGAESYDAVLSTPAPSVLARLAPGLPESWRATAIGQEYSSILCTTLVLKRPLSPIYWMWISDPQVPFSGLIEHTNYIPPSEYGGRSIAYISHYTYPDEPIFNASSAEVMAQYLPQLQRMNPSFDESWIEKKIFAHDRYAQPIVGPGYARQLLPWATPVPGLFSAAMSQVFPEDRGTNYAVRAGNQAADAVDEYLRRST